MDQIVDDLQVLLEASEAMEGCHILRIWLNINGLYSIYSFTSLLIHKKCGNSIIILKISYWIPGETSEKRLKSKLSANKSN